MIVMGIVDPYQFIPLLMALTLPKGQKVSCKETLSGSFSHIILN